MTPLVSRGSANAGGRLGGLYALEQLAQDHRAHRQRVVEVLCGYLRMPYVPPEEACFQEDLSLSDYEEAALPPMPSSVGAEQQIRETAQRILVKHLCPVAEVGDFDRRHGDQCRFGEAGASAAERLAAEPPPRTIRNLAVVGPAS